MTRFLFMCLAFLLLAPHCSWAARNPGMTVYNAQFMTWPTVRNEHGYVGAEGNKYVMEAVSNTWMGPGKFLPVTTLNGDFTMDISFRVLYRNDCSLQITLSDAGSDYSQLDFFFDIWQSGAPTFSIYENSVRNDFYVNISRRFAERSPIRQGFPIPDWKNTNRLSINRKGNSVTFSLNGKALRSFLSPAFPVKKLGLGISFKSRIHIVSVKAVIPR